MLIIYDLSVAMKLMLMYDRDDDGGCGFVLMFFALYKYHGFFYTLTDSGYINHLTAIIEVKLKHWNH